MKYWLASKYFSLFIVVFFTISTPVTAASLDQQVEENIARINFLYTQSYSNISDQELLAISSHVIGNRSLYSANLIAKTYALLADNAIAKADIAKAFQFAFDGLTISPIAVEIQLDLLQKLANGYYINNQYHKTIEAAEQAISLAKLHKKTRQLLIALSYRAMAYSLTADYELAIADLGLVEEMLAQYPQYNNQVELLEIMAIAHHHLGDHELAVSINQKIISLKLADNNSQNVGQNYYHLALCYQAINRFDDAYNAFWQAQKSVTKEKAPIRLAYIQLGFGKMLLSQKKFDAAYQRLAQAQQLFLGKNQTQPYLTTLIFLAKAASNIEQPALAAKHLANAKQIAPSVELNEEQIELYYQLFLMHKNAGDEKAALVELENYVEQLARFRKNHASHHAWSTSTINSRKESKQIAGKIVNNARAREQETPLPKDFNRTTLLLIICIILLSILSITQWIRKKNLLMKAALEANERPKYFVHSSGKIKDLYQRQYKMSRKYQFPTVIAFVNILNWRELIADVSAKACHEVEQEIATLINNNINEFDEVGQLNTGQYLLLFPHQDDDEAKLKLRKIKESLKVSFFANLGNVSLIAEYAHQTPTVQDIDPYIFLSRLSEQTRAS